MVEDRIGYLLKRAQQALRTRMDEALRDLGITTPQYSALAALYAEPGLSGAQLARRGFVTPQTMNGVVVNLETGGLVARHPDPEHGRIFRAYLTEEGARLLAQCHRQVESVEELMLARLDREERDRFAEALRTCAESLESYNPSRE